MITQNTFDAKMDSLIGRKTKKIAAALSGGSDSMALVLLCANWARASGVKLVALTVDHGLRPESAKEARQAGAWMRLRGIAHEILTYAGAKPESNIEGAAREYRYAMLTDYCRKHRIPALLVAHNLDEQAETFFLNLARGSGVFGLAGMPEISERGGVKIARPMLEFSKDEIKAYLRARRQKWIEDPSNRDGKYKRVRVRGLKKLLDALEMTPARIALTIANMRRAREAIESYAGDLIARAVKIRSDGTAALDTEIFNAAPAEVAMRALAELLRRLSGADYPPRLESLENLYGKIAGGTLGKGATLAGFKFSSAKNGLATFEPEKGRIKKPACKK
ncbi:MAG: tRNA lysidine(34) synthetase TilS [Rickettsiales bacterium]|nr:tRNA lysidine(34) synthetase TilS [Rickettsiales bacterium]